MAWARCEILWLTANSDSWIRLPHCPCHHEEGFSPTRDLLSLAPDLRLLPGFLLVAKASYDPHRKKLIRICTA